MTDSKNQANRKINPSPSEKISHPKDPLHGISLKDIVTQLEENYGWRKLAELIPINCFKSNPSIKSSLTFLRKTPWARTKVETLYIKSKANWGKYKK